MSVKEHLLRNGSEFCASCLGGSAPFVKLWQCDTTKRNPERPDMLRRIFEALMLEYFKKEERDTTMICAECEIKLELCSSFLEGCVQADQFLKSQVVKLEVDPDYLEGQPQDTEIEGTAITPKEEYLEFNSHQTSILSELGPNCKPDIQHPDIVPLEDDNRLEVDLNIHIASQLALNCSPQDDNTLVNLYVCPICSESFNLSPPLIHHIKKNHAEIGLTERNPKYHCACGKSFDRSKKLMCHKITEHGLQISKTKFFKQTCLICEKVFCDQRQLEIHANIHFGVKAYQCPQCSLSFSEPASLESHKKVAHKSRRKQTLPIVKPPCLCDDCGKFFMSKKYLRKHFVRVHASPSFRCTVDGCFKSFRTNGNTLQSHLRRHDEIRKLKEVHRYRTKSSPKSLEDKKPVEKSCACPICRELFTTRPSCRNHLKEVHGQDSMHFRTVFPCSCGKYFKQEIAFRFHQVVAHSNTEYKDQFEEYTCRTCGKMFLSRKYLAFHENRHLGVTPYLCSYCPTSYASAISLEFHEKYKHLGKQKPAKTKTPWLCDNCGISFTTKRGLKRHILCVHSQVRSFRCNLKGCDKAFKMKELLNRHIVNHNAKRDFICDICNFGFKSKFRCQMHINRVHLNIRPFKCKTCKMKFKTKAHLQKHERTHTGERPFPCPHCEYTCAEKSNLQKHIKIHDRLRSNS